MKTHLLLVALLIGLIFVSGCISNDSINELEKGVRIETTKPAPQENIKPTPEFARVGETIVKNGYKITLTDVWYNNNKTLSYNFRVEPDIVEHRGHILGMDFIALYDPSTRTLQRYLPNNFVGGWDFEELYTTGGLAHFEELKAPLYLILFTGSNPLPAEEKCDVPVSGLTGGHICSGQIQINVSELKNEPYAFVFEFDYIRDKMII